MSKVFDTIILGGGPAGLTAALYAGRATLDTLLIERGMYGGQIATTYTVDNYPGSDLGVTGPDIADKMRAQAEAFGTNFVQEDIQEVSLEGDIKTVKTRKNEYKAKTIIIATGASPKLAGFKGEDQLTGRGVSYCATCDGAFYSELEIAVVGGGDSAVEESLFLTKFAKKVTIIHRRDEFRAAQYLVDKAKENPKIEFLLDSVVEETISEENSLTGLKVKNVKTNEISDLDVSGVFVFVGYDAITDLYKGQVKMNRLDEILTDTFMQTNIPGVFAAGDVRETVMRQVVTATSDGAVAAFVAGRYLSEIE